MTLTELAKKVRPLIEFAVQGLADKEASECVTLFRRLKQDGKLVEAQTRINWNGTLKRAKVALWDIESQDPDHAPELWDDVSYRDGIRIAPTEFTSTNAAKYGELMWFGDKVYKSLMDGNNFFPDQVPSVWELITKE